VHSSGHGIGAKCGEWIGNKLSIRSSIFGYLTSALAMAAILLCASPPVYAVANEDAVAVVIGNSNYTADRIPKVDYAHRDAEAFKRYLIDILGYREGNIIDLRDATQAQMEAALGNDRTHEGTLWQYIRPEGSDVTVFYSGHGVPGLKSKRGYLLPVNADPNKPEINGYPVDTLYANLAKLPARSVTVYLDACFSGDSPKGMLINATSGITVTPRLPKQRNKLIILTAASGDQVASWDLENRHGLFTEHLLAALYGAADAARYGAADGNVTVGEVKKYLARNMTYAAKRTYGRIQHATINGSSDMVLAALGANHPKRPEIDTDNKKIASLPPPTKPVIRLEPIEGTYVVVRNANVRARPSVDALKVTTLRKGSKVHVAGKVASKDWLAVDRDGKRLGYVYSKLLQDLEAFDVARKQNAEAKANRNQDDLLWNSIKNSRDPAAFKAYLEQYPKGLHKWGALLTLEELKRRQVAAIKPPKMTVLKPAKPAAGVYPKRYRPGDTFKDCPDCPEMIVVPPGQFRMGDLQGGGYKDEKPHHNVQIGYSFAVGKFEVTLKEWDACIHKSGCGSGRARNAVWGLRRPVVKVSWADASAYVGWLSQMTGQRYRLLSEAEWEYVARAGTVTKYSWGNGFDPKKASRDLTSGVKSVGSFPPNAFGLYDVHGNAWEWVSDCWHANYIGAPSDGAAWSSGGDCTRRVLRGGSWSDNLKDRRSAIRSGGSAVSRDNGNGFRVARTLSR
jgi:formylglycine-generating enzyme required for sulfatase activity